MVKKNLNFSECLKVHISVKMPKNLFLHYPTDWNEIQHLSATDTRPASFNKSGEPSPTPDPNPTHNGHPEAYRPTEMLSICTGPRREF